QRAWMHEEGIGGPQNIPAAFNLYEQAIAHEALDAENMLQQHLFNYSEEQTSNLLNSLWQPLIDRKSISQVTLDFLIVTCRNQIIQELSSFDSIIGTSIKILRQISEDNAHPLAYILFHENTHEQALRDNITQRIQLISSQR